MNTYTFNFIGDHPLSVTGEEIDFKGNKIFVNKQSRTVFVTYEKRVQSISISREDGNDEKVLLKD